MLPSEAAAARRLSIALCLFSNAQKFTDRKMTKLTFFRPALHFQQEFPGSTTLGSERAMLTGPQRRPRESMFLDAAAGSNWKIYSLLAAAVDPCVNASPDTTFSLTSSVPFKELFFLEGVFLDVRESNES
jgi:hypothetical protein